eukprot:CAMPEP_0181289826 /NCGR_PEP_ID=MMETSP1101-20121128/1091_1 /TAXON_ID=46948 /ORGANISM="Rhodomonas abbreviata, Strain Caron Lab Isolate" /LENGTH=243 /DNA_ID=CAMNT_0023394077 /DNA_START=195 /DNA_END=926 /DNA_ORIENTATION=-
MKLTVRKPDGGEAVLVVRTTDSVERLRAMLQWCVKANDWDCNAIPADIKNSPRLRDTNAHNSNETIEQSQKEEMWALGGEADVFETADAQTHKPWELPQEEPDFEATSRSDTIHEDESSGRIEMMHGPIVIRDGYKLADYGVECGSFIHPLYGLRTDEGRTWDHVVTSLPWRDREWYRAGVSIGASYGWAATAAVQESMGSVKESMGSAISWWSSSMPGEATETATAEPAANLRSAEEQNSAL